MKLCRYIAFGFMLLATAASVVSPTYSMVLQCIAFDFLIFGWLVKNA